MPASGGRSISKRLTSSAAKCCASAAEPPLPQASTLPPARSEAASSKPACTTGAPSAWEASRLSCALSAKCRATRSSSAASACFMPRDSTLSLHEDFELDAPRRIRMPREAADARAQRLAALEAPGQRGVLAPRHVTKLAAAPRHADGVAVERIVGLARELEAVADAQR